MGEERPLDWVPGDSESHEPAGLESGCEPYMPTNTKDRNRARRSNIAEHIAYAELSSTAKLVMAEMTLGMPQPAGVPLKGPHGF